MPNATSVLHSPVTIIRELAGAYADRAEACTMPPSRARVIAYDCCWAAVQAWRVILIAEGARLDAESRRLELFMQDFKVPNEEPQDMDGTADSAGTLHLDSRNNLDRELDAMVTPEDIREMGADEVWGVYVGDGSPAAYSADDLVTYVNAVAFYDDGVRTAVLSKLEEHRTR